MRGRNLGFISTLALVCLTGLGLRNAVAATITWTGNAGTESWHTPGNWDLNRVPADFDDAVIPDLSGNNTVRYNNGTTVSLASLQCAETLRLASGTLALDGASTIANFILEAGTLAGTGVVDVSASFASTSGSLAGLGRLHILPGATWSVSNSFTVIARLIENDGVGHWTSGTIQINSGGQFQNDGEFRIEGGSDWRDFSGGSARLTNNGLLRKDTTTNEFNISSPLINNGSLEVATGILGVTAEGPWSGATNIANGAILKLIGGSLSFGAGASLTVDGELNPRGGSFTLAAGPTVSWPGVFRQSGGTSTFDRDTAIPTVILEGGILSGSGLFEPTNSLSLSNCSLSGSGRFHMPSGLSWTISSGNVNFNRLVENDGIGHWTGGTIIFNNPGQFQNDGEFHDEGGFDWRDFSGGTARFTNNGLFRKESSGNEFTLAAVFENNGTLEVLTGTLGLTVSGTWTTQTLVANGARLRLNGGSLTFGAAATLTVNGELDVRGGSITFPVGPTISWPGALHMGGGTVAFDRDFAIPDVNLEGGILAGSGLFEPTHSLFLSNCSLSGSGRFHIPSGMSWTISSGTVNFNRLVENDGIGHWTGGTIIFNNPGQFQNDSEFHVEGGNDWRDFSGGTAIFTNNGLFRKETSGNEFNFAATFVNNGTIDLLTGTLGLTVSGTWATQTNIASGARLRLNNGSLTFSPAASLTVDGVLEVRGASVTIPVGPAVSWNGTLHLSSGIIAFDRDFAIPTVIIEGGTLAGSGLFEPTSSLSLSNCSLSGSGRFHIPSGMSWTISSGTVNFNRLVENDGIGHWTGGTVIFNNPGQFQNDGEFHVEGGNDWRDFSGGTSTLTNNGLFRKETVANDFVLAAKFVNDGSVEVLTGLLGLTLAGSWSGQTTIASGAQLRLDSGSLTFASSATLTVNGELHVRGATITVPVGPTVTWNGTLRVANGSIALNRDAAIPNVIMQGGTLTGSGRIEPTTSFSMAGGALAGTGLFHLPSGLSWTVAEQGGSWNRAIENDGIGHWTSGTLIFNAPGQFQNDGEFHVEGANDWRDFSGGTARFVNNGLFRQAPGSPAFDYATPFDNQGTVEVKGARLQLNSANLSGGALSGNTYDVTTHLRLLNANVTALDAAVVLRGPSALFTDNFSQDAIRNLSTIGASGRLVLRDGASRTQTTNVTNSGALELGPNGATFNAAGGYSQASGRTVLVGGTLQSASAIALNGGTLEGTGTVQADLVNGGTVAPGASPGAISVTGSYQQTGSGRLAVELAGDQAGTQFDLLQVSGPATLAGNLDVSQINGFEASIPSSFDVLTAASVSGSFGSSNLPVALDGGCLVSELTPTTVRLNAIAAPVVTQNPQSQAICLGESVTFTAGISGAEPLTIQWKKNDVDIPGADEPSFTIQSVTADDAGTYTVHVANACEEESSTGAVLSVLQPVAVTLDPVSQTACESSTVVLTAAASGFAPSFQWRHDGQPLPNQTGTSLTLSALEGSDGGTYDVVVSNTCNSVTSVGALVTVTPSTRIVNSPSGTTVCAGVPVSFSVVATGDALSFQWRKDTQPISGATASSFDLPITTTDDSGSYDVVVTGTCGALTSAPAVLVVTVCEGPTGACCFESGVCSVIGESDCGNAGGTYQGNDTVCDPNPCPQPPPPPTTGACCASSGECTTTTAKECAGSLGTYQGDDTVCSPNPCPQPPPPPATGACCASSGECTITTVKECAGSLGTYQGDDTVCSPNPCPQPPPPPATGACCAGSGACTIETAAECAADGGVYQGDSTVCSPNPCPQPVPTGACCASSGNCTVTTAANCAAAGGRYQGDNTVCDPNPCPPPATTGACCLPLGRCLVTTEQLCLRLRGAYKGSGSVCDPNPCLAPGTGACCIRNGSRCIILTEAECGRFRGHFLGTGTSCSPSSCVPGGPGAGAANPNTQWSTWGEIKRRYTK